MEKKTTPLTKKLSSITRKEKTKSIPTWAKIAIAIVITIAMYLMLFTPQVPEALLSLYMCIPLILIAAKITSLRAESQRRVEELYGKNKNTPIVSTIDYELDKVLKLAYALSDADPNEISYREKLLNFVKQTGDLMELTKFHGVRNTIFNVALGELLMRKADIVNIIPGMKLWTINHEPLFPFYPYQPFWEMVLAYHFFRSKGSKNYMVEKLRELYHNKATALEISSKFLDSFGKKVWNTWALNAGDDLLTLTDTELVERVLKAVSCSDNDIHELLAKHCANLVTIKVAQ